MTSASLELDASQALFSARVMAEAIHENSGWEMQWGPVRVPVVRQVRPDGVLFVATFPPTCWMTRPEGVILLLLDGEIRGTREADHPGDTGFEVSWSMSMRKVVV